LAFTAGIGGGRHDAGGHQARAVRVGRGACLGVEHLVARDAQARRGVAGERSRRRLPGGLAERGAGGRGGRIVRRDAIRAVRGGNCRWSAGSIRRPRTTRSTWFALDVLEETGAVTLLPRKGPGSARWSSTCWWKWLDDASGSVVLDEQVLPFVPVQEPDETGAVLLARGRCGRGGRSWGSQWSWGRRCPGGKSARGRCPRPARALPR
jgi:hypothetical protein